MFGEVCDTEMPGAAGNMVPLPGVAFAGIRGVTVVNFTDPGVTLWGVFD